MKALIIGGAGFVGNYLLHHLQNDCGFTTSVTKLPHEVITDEQASIYDLDILKQEDILALLNKVRPDYIFHLAAQSSVALSWKRPDLTVDINVKGSLNLLEALRALDYKPRVLLIGSGEEYGHIRPEETPVHEEVTPRPGNIYAATKACVNMLGHIYADAYGLDLMMVRAFNHIGPNQAPLFVVADFCKQVAEIEKDQTREKVIRVGNLAAKRDFTDVRDVVRGYSLLIQHGVRGESYNIGSGSAISIDDILHMILDLSKVSIKVEIDPERLRPIDIPIIEADIHKFQTCTGWKKEIPLTQTIEETLNYWRQY